MLHTLPRYILDTLWRIKSHALVWAVVHVPLTVFALRSLLLGERSWLISVTPVAAIAATMILLSATARGPEFKLLQSIPLSTAQRGATLWWCGMWIFVGFFCLLLTPLSVWILSLALRMSVFEFFATAASWIAYCIGALGYFIATGHAAAWLAKKLRSGERERPLRWMLYGLEGAIRIALVVVYFLYFDLVLSNELHIYSCAALGAIALLALYFRANILLTWLQRATGIPTDAADSAMIERIETFVEKLESRRHPALPSNTFGWRVICIPIAKLAIRRLLECCAFLALMVAVSDNLSLRAVIPMVVAATGFRDMSRWLVGVHTLKALPIPASLLTTTAIALVAYPIVTAWVFMILIQVLWRPFNDFSVTAAMLIASLQLFAAPVILRFARHEESAHWLGFAAVCLLILIPFVRREYMSIPVALILSVILLVGNFVITRYVLTHRAQPQPQTRSAGSDAPWTFRGTT